MVVTAACTSGDGGDPDTLVDQGRVVYATSCASCHGSEGSGDPNWRVRLADGSLPPPPHDATGHTWHHADGLLFRIVTNGAAEYGTGNMPAFGDSLTDQQIHAVIEFLKTLWGPEERAVQSRVSEQDPYPPFPP
jgi:mono/diheme cytochrome c family protein